MFYLFSQKNTYLNESVSYLIGIRMIEIHIQNLEFRSNQRF